MTAETTVCVVGAGAIGSLFAAHLATEPGTRVYVYDVDRAHVAAINRSGLTVTGASDFTARVHASFDPADIPPCDFGIVATKGEHTRSAIAAVAGSLRDAAVVSVQNGLGNEEAIAQFVPRVIRGTTIIAGALAGPATVRFDATGSTWIGPFEPSPAPTPAIERLASLLTTGGLPTSALADARGAQWSKLVFNASTSAIAALTGLTIGQIGEDPGLHQLVVGLIDEARRIADAHGIVLDGDPAKMVDAAVAEAYDHRPSMLQDVLAQRRTEVDVLNGGIVAAGAEVGIPAPLHASMVFLVTGLERHWREPLAGH